MHVLEVQDLDLTGLKVIKYKKFADERGYFLESFRLDDVRAIPDFGKFEIKQGNESYSKKNVVRGLHFQWNEPMGKLVRTIRGRMIDIALDIRKNSPTLGKVILYEMVQNASDEIGQWIWLPPGFAHGNFFTEDTIIEYFCTTGYNPECEKGISVFSGDIDFNLADSNLKKELDEILKNNPLISKKDKAGLTLQQWKEDPNFSQFIFSS